MPGRVTATVDGTKFNVVDAEFVINTQKDQAGMPVLGTLDTSVRFRVDLNDDKNCNFQTLKKMFDLANVPSREKIKEFKFEFWQDDEMKNVICSYSFKGWFSSFRTSNVGGENNGRHYNHVLDAVVTPIVNKENHHEVSLGN
jgi:hypothetical protein